MQDATASTAQKQLYSVTSSSSTELLRSNRLSSIMTCILSQISQLKLRAKIRKAYQTLLPKKNNINHDLRNPIKP